MACASATNVLALSAHQRSARCSFRARTVLRRVAPAGARGAAVVAHGVSEQRSGVEVTRRDCLAVLAAVPLLAARPALADDEMKTFYGACSRYRGLLAR